MMEFIPDSLQNLWMRVVADSRREIEALHQAPADLDALFATHWPVARQAAIQDLAREEAVDDERLYEAACRRLELEIPQEYPFAHGDEASEG